VNWRSWSLGLKKFLKLSLEADWRVERGRIRVESWVGKQKGARDSATSEASRQGGCVGG
jgi:hypothetical protein